VCEGVRVRGCEDVRVKNMMVSIRLNNNDRDMMWQICWLKKKEANWPPNYRLYYLLKVLSKKTTGS
jgi:hypothetical protein